MKGFAFIVLAALAAGCVMTPEGYRTQIYAYVAHQQFPECVEFSSSYLSKNPAAGEPYYWRGVCQRRMKNYELAVSDLSRAVELGLDPHNRSSAYLNMGSAAMFLGRYKDCAADLQKAVQNPDPESAFGFEHWDLLGECSYHAALYDDAAQQFTQAIGQDERTQQYHAGNYLLRAMSREAAKDYAPAVEDVKTILAQGEALGRNGSFVTSIDKDANHVYTHYGMPPTIAAMKKSLARLEKEKTGWPALRKSAEELQLEKDLEP